MALLIENKAFRKARDVAEKFIHLNFWVSGSCLYWSGL
jgi:hypothetical protein